MKLTPVRNKMPASSLKLKSPTAMPAEVPLLIKGCLRNIQPPSHFHSSECDHTYLVCVWNIIKSVTSFSKCHPARLVWHVQNNTCIFIKLLEVKTFIVITPCALVFAGVDCRFILSIWYSYLSHLNLDSIILSCSNKLDWRRKKVLKVAAANLQSGKHLLPDYL